MPLPPIPVDRELVPDTRQPVPDNLTRVRQSLVRGVPFSWPLDSELDLTLFVPTGTAILWRDADPTATVCDSTLEAAPYLPGAPGTLPRAPARLLLRRSQETVAIAPLVAGLWHMLPDGDGDSSIVELYVVDFLIAAGTLRGVGDFGSFVEVAWRRSAAGAATFTVPPIDPRVALRQGLVP